MDFSFFVPSKPMKDMTMIALFLKNGELFLYLRNFPDMSNAMIILRNMVSSTFIFFVSSCINFNIFHSTITSKYEFELW